MTDQPPQNGRLPPLGAMPGARGGPPQPPQPPKAPKPPRKLGWLKWVAGGLAAMLVLTAVAAGVGYHFVQTRWLADLPPIPDSETLYASKRTPGIRFLDRNGEVIATRGPRFGDRIHLADLPPHVARAFLAAEDVRFYQHGALDYQGLVRAAWTNWRAGRVVQGGSTLTQQVVKDLFLGPERKFKRKAREAVLAYRLEDQLTKDEVLELYLNRIYFGANTYGIDGAARTYFGKPARELTLGEAALLAALPKAPSKLALTRDLPGAMARGRLVLANMAAEGWITEDEARSALAAPPQIAAGAAGGEGAMGYVLDYATAEAVRITGPDAPALVVRLSIDKDLQQAAADAVREGLAGQAAGATQGALIALAPDGAIRAMVGGSDYLESSFNRAVQAKRQPGSTFKAFVYAAALEAGILPTDVRVDQPVKIGDWSPANYGGGYAGPVTLETAFAKSINTVAVELAQEVGPAAVSNLAHRFGLASIPPTPDLSVALGAYEVNLLDLTSAFQVFQQGGQRSPAYLVEAITAQDGTNLYARQPPAPVAVYDPARAAMMVRMMKQVVTAGTGTRAAFDWPAAGKTGTSQNWRDAWFVGFTPEWTAGVWLGDDSGKPMSKVTGGALPAEIWRRFMVRAHQGLAPRDFTWLGASAESEAEARYSFYQGLAADFGQVAGAPEITPVETPEPESPYAPEPAVHEAQPEPAAPE